MFSPTVQLTIRVLSVSVLLVTLSHTINHRVCYAPLQYLTSCSVFVRSYSQVEGELIWSKKMQGSVLSAFFWGYLFSQVLGGYLSALIGGKIVIGAAVVASAVLSLLSPIAATTHIYYFIAIRAMLGLAQVK